MKKLITLTIQFFLVFNFIFGQDSGNYFTDWDLDFKAGSTQFLFGNNVKLRDAPNLKSELVELIEIDKKVKILEKTEATDIFKDVAYPWYKVQVGNKTGYILGALIAHYKLSDPSKKVDFYFHINPEYKDKGFSISIKTYGGKELLDATQFNPIGHRFSFKVSGNRGFYDISSIVMVDYMSEACGVEGGITYLFWDEEDLTHVANLSSVGDGGILHYDEQFIFPDDPEGMNDGKSKIIYKQESGEEVEEKTQWYITKSQSRVLNWDNKKKQMIPKNFQTVPKL